MIKLESTNIMFDINIDGEHLTPEFKKRNSVDILGYRCVRTSGIALPTFELIISSTNEDWLNKFNEQNKIEITIGTDVEHVGTYTAETVGHNIKEDASHSLFLLYWGGVLTKNKLGSNLLKDHMVDRVVTGTAYEAMKITWDKFTGNSFIADFPGSKDMSKQHDKKFSTIQNFLAELQLRIDIRDSFPMCTIGLDGNLYCKSFKVMKANGPVHVFVPSAPGVKNKYKNSIYYVGDPNTVSYKSYTNRYTGYKQMSARDAKTGKVRTVASSMANSETGWSINTLATTGTDERNPNEHRIPETFNLTVDDDTNPIEMHEVRNFNKMQLINMSSIQTTLRCEGVYLDKINVLDLVDLKTQMAADNKSGLYIIEAIEQGFMYGKPFVNNVWLCRDNYNDVERTRANPYQKTAMKMLNINPKTRANICESCRNIRQGLVTTRGFLDGTTQNRIIQHLIQMRQASLANFDLFDSRLNLNDTSSAISTLRRSGLNLVQGMINKYVPSPLDMTLSGFMFGNAKMFNLLLSVFAGLVGSDMYGVFAELFTALREFDYFLEQYGETVVHVNSKIIPNYSETPSTGVVRFVESPDGSISYETEDNSDMTISQEQKSEIVQEVISDIEKNIPDDVDLPIPEIVIGDSDAIKPRDELKEDIVDYIVKDLVDKGYIYDDDQVKFDMSEVDRGEIQVVQANGEIIDGNEAREVMVAASTLKSALLGNTTFGTNIAYKLKKTTGTDLKTRFWGTFTSPDQLTSTYVTTNGYVDMYRGVTCTKTISVRGGKRIYVALPSLETNVKFYINSQRVDMVEDDRIEYASLGYTDKFGKPIAYTIYYTSEYYNSSAITLEIRKGK